MPKEALSLLFLQNDYIASPDTPVPFNQCENFSELFCVNPLHPTTDFNPTKPWHRHDKPRRADLNVTTFRNFIFESDCAALDEQMAAINKIDALVRMAAFSGNKSISFIVSAADTLPFKPHDESGVWDYKLAWQGLKLHLEALTGLTFDPSTKNPSRLTRTPGVVRADTGKVQELLYTGPLVTADFILSLMSRSVKQNAVYSVKPDVASLRDFEALLAKERLYLGLRNKLQNAHLWAKPVNMYPEIIKLTFWAIDATSVPLEVLRAYMWDHTFPALLEVGYPRQKIEDGLINGYKHKRLL